MTQTRFVSLSRGLVSQVIVKLIIIIIEDVEL